MSEWKSVYKEPLEYRANIVRDVLRDRDIPATVFTKKDSAYGFGYFEVHVPTDEVILALKIIEENIRFE